MVLVRRLAYVASLVLIPACGQSLNNPPANGTGSDGGSAVSKDMAGGKTDAAPSAVIDMAGFNQSGSPVVTIVSPTATTEVATPHPLAVEVTVTSPTNTVINTSSVMVQLTPPGGAVLTAPLSPTTTPGHFAGSITLPDAIVSGTSTFTVVASDINGLMGSAQGTYIRDKGPQIKFILPTAAAIKGGSGKTVQIIIDDTLHPITDISQVKVGIRAAADVTQITQVPGVTPFQVTGSFDTTLFTPPLDGPQQITAQATNSNGTTGVGRQTFAIDDSGPVITVVTPDNTKFASNPMAIEVTVTDALSPLDTTSVWATLGGDPSKSVHLQLSGAVTPPIGTVGYQGTFIGTFDLRALGTSYVFPELSVEAQDILLNPGQFGEEILVDNTRPWVTMDGKPSLRVAKETPAGTPIWECSNPFRPLGDEALFDQQTLVNQQLLNVRARIQDFGNWAPGLSAQIYSGLDWTSIKMYAIPDDGKTALAVDTDADGFCDAVNPTLKPTDQLPQAGQVLSLAMSSRPTSGTPNYVQYTPTSSISGCDLYGEAGGVLPPLACTLIATSLDYILYSTDGGKNIGNSQLFTLGPVDAATGSISCMGRQLDTANYFTEGWNCLITSAADVIGNSMVSYPIHVCIDRGNKKCTTSSVPPTDCTGIYDSVQKKLVPGTCAMPPQPTSVNPFPNPGTFPNSGSEVVHLFQ